MNDGLRRSELADVLDRQRDDERAFGWPLHMEQDCAPARRGTGRPGGREPAQASPSCS